MAGVGLEVLVEVIVGRLRVVALELWDPTLWSGRHCGQGAWHDLAVAHWERAELSVDEGRRQEGWEEEEEVPALVKQQMFGAWSCMKLLPRAIKATSGCSGGRPAGRSRVCRTHPAGPQLTQFPPRPISPARLWCGRGRRRPQGSAAARRGTQGARGGAG